MFVKILNKINELLMMKIAILQLASHPKSYLKSLLFLQKKLTQWRGFADLLVLPEMWPGSFQPEHAAMQWLETQHCLIFLKKYAQHKKIWILSPMLRKLKNDTYTNCIYLINAQGKVMHHYDKIHLFTYQGEHERFATGKKMVIAKIAGIKIGLAICYDLRFPEMFRNMVTKGVEVFFVVAAWPAARKDHFLTLLKARAIENLAYVVGVNKVGVSKESTPYAGYSSVFDPWGNLVMQLQERPKLVCVTLDLKKVSKVRQAFPALLDRQLR